MIHSLRVGLVMLIAVWIHFYFSWSHEYWIILSAFLLCQTTLGTSFRQNLYIFVLIILGLVVSSFLLNTPLLVNAIVIAGLFISVGFLLFLKRPLSNAVIYSTLLFPLMLLVATLTNTDASLQDRLIDACEGAAIAIIILQIIFPVSVVKEFQRGLIPVLNAVSSYSMMLTQAFIGQTQCPTEFLLRNSTRHYPEWAYEIGFNPGLRSGFRFFLIHLEAIIEILSSMDYLLSCPVSADLIQPLSDALTTATQRNQDLLRMLIDYFSKKNLTFSKQDFTSDIDELENNLKRVIPTSLELLDIKKEYVTLTQFVRSIKEIRQLLLQLLMALPPGGS